MSIKIKCVAAIAMSCIVPVCASAASLTISDFTGTHFHEGGNTGSGYLTTTDADRTDGIPITPGGLALGTVDHAYSGAISNVAGVRIGRTKTSALTYGLMEDDGFFFGSSVSTEAECTEKSGVSFGCRPFMGNQAAVSFSFSVDVDSVLFFDGTWFGGNGTLSPVSVVDYLSLSIRQDNGSGGFLVPYRVDTNIENRNEAAGIFDGSVALSAGETYLFDFNHRAHAQAPDAEGVVVMDDSFLSFAASIIESNADVDAFEGRYEAAASAVPLPAAGWMLFAGVGALTAMRRRKRG